MPNDISRIQRLNHALADRYRIKRELGQGGMATVYLAEDVKHERDVAVKVLRPELVAVLGPDRFLQEIKLTARLNHPHILSLLDSGDADGIIYYVMPYVEGESLRHRLNRETHLPIDEVCQLGQQIASALHYAHQQGVVHRDIKPENILLHAGEAMVADFGIALALSAAGGDRLTETGFSLGTPEYMSPEQASGARDVDARSDVYSLGCVLYEMLAGEPPFTAQTSQAVIARQVLDPPSSLRTVRPSLSQELEAAVLKALAKTPADRWQNAEAFVAVLGERSGSDGISVSGMAAVKSQHSKNRWIWMLVLLVAITGAGLVVANLVRDGGRVVDIRPPSYTKLTSSGSVSHAEISPAGDILAYMEVGDIPRVVVRDLHGDRIIPIANVNRKLWTMRWRPDASRLMISDVVDGVIRTYAYPPLGGTRQLLPAMGRGDWAKVWGPRGFRLASWGPYYEPVRIINLNTERMDSIVAPDSLLWLGAGDWSPNGRHLALTTLHKSTSQYSIWLVDLNSSSWRQLLKDSLRLSGPRWSPRGDAIYFLGGNALRKQRVGSDGRAEGEPQVLDGNLDAFFDLTHSGFSLTRDGKQLVYTRMHSRSNLFWVPPDPMLDPVRLTNSTTQKSAARISPIGERFAYFQYTEGGGDVFVVQLNEDPIQLTSEGFVPVWGTGFAPAWSPEGDRIAFPARRDRKVMVHTVHVESRDTRWYALTDVRDGGLDWGRDGRILYPGVGNESFWFLDPETEVQEPLVFGDSAPAAWMGQAFHSPNDNTVLVQRTEQRRGGERGIAVVRQDDSGYFFLVDDPATPRGWSADGNFVFFQRDGSAEILRIPVSGGQIQVARVVPYGPLRSHETSGASIPGENADCFPVDRPEGLALVCNVNESESDVWMIENFDPDIR